MDIAVDNRSNGRHHGGSHPHVWAYVHASLWVVAGGLFLLMPWSLEAKSLALLHGLCAQQPSHSFYFGDARLPFDARMTGIYGGFLSASAVMWARGRWRAGGLPPLWIGVVLVGFVALMGLDGLNSTLQDLGHWNLYQPHNILRLTTGLLTGTTLAAFIWLMVIQLSYAPHSRLRRPAFGNAQDLFVVLAAASVFVALVYSGWVPLRVPLTLVLIVSAILVLSGLALSFVLLLTRTDGRAHSTLDLAMPATIALLVAFVLIAAMSGGRFALESWLGVPASLGGI